MLSMDEPRSYYEAFRRRGVAEGRGHNAVFVDRGSLRAVQAASRPPLPLERRIIDRDDYVGFLEDQLEKACAAVLRFETEVEGKLQGQLDELKKRADLHDQHTSQIVNAVELTSRRGVELHERGVRGESRVDRCEVRVEAVEKVAERLERRLDVSDKGGNLGASSSSSSSSSREERERLERVETQAAGFVARVVELERAVSETLYVLEDTKNNGERQGGSARPLEDCVRELRAEVSHSKKAAHRAEARCSELASTAQAAERASRDFAEAASRHADTRSLAVVEALADLERRHADQLAALAAKAAADRQAHISEADIEARHVAALAALESKHAATAADLETRHLRIVADMESRHVASIQDLETRLLDTIAKPPTRPASASSCSSRGAATAEQHHATPGSSYASSANFRTAEQAVEAAEADLAEARKAAQRQAHDELHRADIADAEGAKRRHRARLLAARVVGTTSFAAALDEDRERKNHNGQGATEEDEEEEESPAFDEEALPPPPLRAGISTALDRIEARLNDRLEALDDDDLDELEESLAVLRRRRLPDIPLEDDAPTSPLSASTTMAVPPPLVPAGVTAESSGEPAGRPPTRGGARGGDRLDNYRIPTSRSQTTKPDYVVVVAPGAHGSPPPHLSPLPSDEEDDDLLPGRAATSYSYHSSSMDRRRVSSASTATTPPRRRPDSSPLDPSKHRRRRPAASDKAAVGDGRRLGWTKKVKRTKLLASRKHAGPTTTGSTKGAIGPKWPSSVMHSGPNRAWVPAIKVSTPRGQYPHPVTIPSANSSTSNNR